MTIETISTPLADEERTWPGGRPDEPYEIAMRRGHGVLEMFDVTHGEREPAARIDVSAFADAVTRVEREALSFTAGTVLDVGCGPARIVHAAIETGRLSLGIDLSPASVALARRRGLPVLLRSVFGPMPSAGSWDTIVLLDGNIGIGGDPHALLSRCSALLGANGRILVETHPTTDRDIRFDAVLMDADGRRGTSFPWAQLGASALDRVAVDCGLLPRRSWSGDGRHFTLLEPW